MTEKVIIPQEVADAYKALEVSWNLTEIFKAVTADFEVCDGRIKTLVDWNESGRDDEGAGLMQLLLGQYEVEPEYKVGDWVVCTHLSRALKIIAIQYENSRVQYRDVSNWQPIAGIGRHATPEEIKAEKERQKWAGIEEGDVVINSTTGRVALFGQSFPERSEVEVQIRRGEFEHWEKQKTALYAKRVGASND